MSTVDIYTNENLSADHSLHYLHIMAENKIGVLNRIASLMRRKRYNMEEVSVSFDRSGNAHMIIAIDSRTFDVPHVIRQLEKLYDVFFVEDATFRHKELYNSISVEIKTTETLQSFPFQPNRIVERETNKKAVFILTLAETIDLMRILDAEGYSYRRQIIGLI